MNTNKVGDKIRFSFAETEQQLAETIEPDPVIIMYWEKQKDICPHCKEVIVKGEHHKLDVVEFWIPWNKKIEECTLKDIIFIGRSETATLLLSKDISQEALAQSKVFKNLYKQE